MAVRREASSVAARDGGLEESQDMSKILILDHLTPRMQELYGNAKSFKTRFGFQFCWAKNGTIFLRRSDDSRPLLEKSVAQTIHCQKLGTRWRLRVRTKAIMAANSYKKMYGDKETCSNISIMSLRIFGARLETCSVLCNLRIWVKNG